MEIPVPNSILYTLLCILLVILYKAKRSNSTKTLPPGPWKLPIIGNLHQIMGPLPHHAFRKLAKKYGPIMHLQLGETSNVVITSPEIAKEVFKAHDLVVSDRPPSLIGHIISYGGKNIAFASYGGYWRYLRKLCTIEVLTMKRVKSFRSIREEEVWEFVKNISANEGSIINLSERIFKLTNHITARIAFGKKSRDQEVFLTTLEEMVKLLEGNSIADLFPSVKVLQVVTGLKTKFERIHKEYDRILENIIKDRRENNEGPENLLDVLFKIQEEADEEYPLELENLKAIILDIFVGGSETSSTMVEWAMAELLKNPEVMAKAQAEVRRVYKGKACVDESELHQLKYLTAIVKESLRVHPPGPLLLPRENTERIVVNGYEIPAKTKIIVNAWAIARDPKYWTDPEKFQPERFLDNPVNYNGSYFEYIPFGAGRRICPGLAFSIPSMELPLANLLYHFDWKLPNGLKNEELDMTEAFGAGVRIKKKLSLIPIRYNP